MRPRVARKGKMRTVITYPPTAYMMQYNEMILECQKYERACTGTIKVGRYKTAKMIDKQRSMIFFTKIMKFSKNEDIMWIQTELMSRWHTLKKMYQLTQTSFCNRKILDAQIKVKHEEKVLYLSNEYMEGWNLSDFVCKKQQFGYLKAVSIEETVREIFGLMILGEGFNRLIITHENLFFKIISEDRYKIMINYLSFVGLKFVSRQEDIIYRQDYEEIAMFLDLEALQTGKIDRFQFKLRNFACILLFILLERNPNTFLFNGVQLDHQISRSQAKTLFKEVITPKMNKLLSFPSLKQKMQQLKIDNFEQILRSALNSPSDISNWSNVLNFLQVETRNDDNDQIFRKLARQLWEQESDFRRQILEKRGLGIENGQKAYLILQLGVNTENLILNKNWSQMFQREQFNRQNRALFFRFLSFFNLKNENIRKLMTKKIRKIFKRMLILIHKIESQNDIATVSVEADILLQYPDSSDEE